MISLRPATNTAAWLASLRLPDLAPLRVLPILTIVHLLETVPDLGLLRAPLVILFALGVVFRRWLLAPAFWYVAAAILGTAVYLSWESADNHRYLFVYWCLALCCALSLPRGEQQAALAKTSRWLIALCMLLATAWKVASPDYLDGSFFRYELLLDERFAELSAWTTGISPEQLVQNRALRDSVVEGHLSGQDVEKVGLASTSAVTTVAAALTWWTVGVEGLLGVLFLLPSGRRLALLRNWLLIIFGATTFAVAPVRGFGWMLMLLGFAQCEPEEKQFRYAYLGAFLLIQIYTLPIADLAAYFA